MSARLFERMNMVTGTVALALCFCATASSAAAQIRNPAWLLAGIAPTEDQSKLLGALQREAAANSGAEYAWREGLQKMRAVLEPSQQQVFDVNMQADSVWYLYMKGVNQLWSTGQTPRVSLVRGFFNAWYSYYGAIRDSLQNSAATPAQMQQFWNSDQRQIRTLLSPGEQKLLDKQLAVYTHEAASFVSVHTHDPKRLLAGIVRTASQKAKLAPLLTQLTGASDSAWKDGVQQIRAVLTPKQQQVFDVNVSIASLWGKYETAFEQLWQTKSPPWDQAMKTTFITAWDHYRAASDSLQNVSQTPAQMQQRWENDRLTMRDFLNDNERPRFDQMVRQ